ncbi:MAG: hypothetical protein CME70_17150 [Halobacteriovorax sp.]|nr:hypothetical protein [Halobacteriovorax sp.]|tara:strand:+ start:105171 stop:106436 length:1266 start_codon:yes stop_codon:yes gene_type:complete
MKLTGKLTRLLGVAALVTSVYSTSALSCVDGHGYLPKNDMKIPPYEKWDKSMRGLRGIDESEFNMVLDKVYDVYAPIVRKFNGNLVIQREWHNSEVNAYAERQGSNFIIKMFGGLARHHVMTADGFALVACHEVGHHIGGAPKYPGTWAASEGQSDYFANSKCLRKVFAKDDNEEIIKGMSIPNFVREKCEASFKKSKEQALCMRFSMAGQAAASLFANGNTPQFDTPDPSVVSTTYNKHPQPQCRLDTYFAGSICPVEDDEDMGQSDPNKGSCNRASKEYAYGYRPLCWYKPTNGGGGDNGGGDTQVPTPTVNGQTSVTIRNPNAIVPIFIDVSGISGARGFVLEATKPNATFSNPNGRNVDPVNGGGYVIVSGKKGNYSLNPARQLPGWGSYQFRVLPLDRNRRVLGNFSNSVNIILQP